MAKRYQRGNQKPSDYPCDIFWPLYSLSFFDLRLLIIPLVSSNSRPLYCLSFLDLQLGVIRCRKSKDRQYNILELEDTKGVIRSPESKKERQYNGQNARPLYCLSLDLRLLITPVISFGHCIVCPSSIYGFWLSLWYLLTLDHCVVCP
jgi:hypothetical protein